jgi:hypothetical protein
MSTTHNSDSGTSGAVFWRAFRGHNTNYGNIGKELTVFACLNKLQIV